MIKRTSIILTCSLFMAPLIAAEVPDYFQPDFSIEGTLARLDLREGIVVINDRNLKLAQDLKVYTVNTQFGTAQLLQTGMRVGTNLDHRKIINEIWVLPKDFKLQPQTTHRP